MKKTVGIRFKPAGKIYDFECGAYVLTPGDHVIVQTDQGLGFGTVALPPQTYDEKKSTRKLKKVYCNVHLTLSKQLRHYCSHRQARRQEGFSLLSL